MTDKSYLLGFVLASEYRKKVMITLKDKPLTPTTISDKTDLYPSHVSLTLAELTKKNVVVCLTPKLRKGRLYDLTKEGRDVLKHML